MMVVVVWDMCKMAYMDEEDVRWWLLLDLEDNTRVNELRHLEDVIVGVRN